MRAHPQAGTLRVLVVEDDPDAVSLVAMSLKAGLPEMDLVVEHATSLAQATDRVLAHPRIDVLILDLGLPDAPVDPERMGGLRALVALPDAPPIITVTANLRDLADVARDVGADDHVAKIDILRSSRLASAVRHVLDRGGRAA